MNAPSAGPVATGLASYGTSGALVVIILWLLGLVHVVVPNDVAAAFLVVIGSVLHLIAHVKFNPSAVIAVTDNKDTQTHA